MAKMQIKRVGILSCGKVLALVWIAFGIVIGVIYGLFFMVVGGAMLAGGGRDSGAAGASGFVIGLIMMVAIPIFYGILGFIMGLLGGLIYNIGAGTIGGLELELENMDGGGYAPPAPNYGDQPPYTPGQQQQYPY